MISCARFMPKKTKKQKLLAELHRKIKAVPSLSAQFVKSQNEPEIPTITATNTSTFTYNKHVVSKPKTPISIANYAHVRHDLIKITIFTLFAVIFQSVLYFFLRRG